jgi:hypothetical protein
MIIEGDCLEVMAGMADNSVDAVICDPPYGLAFMGKHWDHGVPGVAFWEQAIRVLKPGGYLLAFGGTRTYHRLAVAIEDAGFEIRDSLHWIYGSGFPKSHDISKAIDREAGAVREVVGRGYRKNDRDANSIKLGRVSDEYDITAPATPDAAQWDGWGSALKPAHEPIIVARKPISERTLAANVLRWGTGGINVDGCRVGTDEIKTCAKEKMYGTGSGENDKLQGFRPRNVDTRIVPESTHIGRFPPNLLLTHSADCDESTCADDCPVAELGRQSGVGVSRKNETSDNRSTPFYRAGDAVSGGVSGRHDPANSHTDTGTAARFFPVFRYVAKASRRERNAGCEGLPMGSQLMTMRPDLTDEERAMVIAELARCGVEL